jgi:hypothetical protein
MFRKTWREVLSRFQWLVALGFALCTDFWREQMQDSFEKRDLHFC